MTKEERANQAVEYKHNGYNCCQAVVKAFSDLIDVDEDTMNKIASGFAVGMGCMEATCGSLIGAVILSGLILDGRGTVPAARDILRQFEKMSGATICKDLKGRDTGKALCDCDDCVRNAVIAALEILNIPK